ncbi:MAG: hypothetical protein KTR25_03875 [Myxococcales bacterium]|nr:hypothetical protein [Myxococcales bacterium]
MSVLWAAIILSSIPYGQTPDELDILRNRDTTPQIQLLLDSSCSMGWDPAPSICDDYPNRQSNMIGSYWNSGWYLSRVDQLKAALTGCKNSRDGILDTWDGRVLFSIREFGGSRTGLLSPFDPNFDNLPALESAVMNLPASGGTPLAPGYLKSAQYFDSFFNNSNSYQCRHNYIVVMSDGVGNHHAPVNFDFISGQSSVSVRDANSCFGTTYDWCPSPPYLDEAARYLYEDANGEEVDALSKVDGVQPIRTYTIGFQAPTAADALLQAMAIEGDGKAFSASSYSQLVQAFVEIIDNIIARSRVAFNTGVIQTSGLFASNFTYSSSFRPSAEGHWPGTTKKYCVIPDANYSDCLFINGSDGLEINPNPRDIWTGDKSSNADQGGTGEVIIKDIFRVNNNKSSPPSSPLTKRTILTWRPEHFGYVAVDPQILSGQETWTSNDCERYSLLTHLHGFTEDLADCDNANYQPLALDRWPIGASIHSEPVLLQYTSTCENTGDKCFVVTAANDGMLHFYNAVTGRETSAIIPAEFWRPNTIAHHTLAERSKQPFHTTSHRYYLDGGLRLHHFDTNTDGTISSGENAYLIVGLGRGGRAYYLMDVSAFSGVPSTRYNPIRPLIADEASGLQDLRDTWATPWTGYLQASSSKQQLIAVFPSGHIPELDEPDAPFANYPLAAPTTSADNEQSPHTISCEDAGIPAEICTTPNPATFCDELGLSCSSSSRCSPCNEPDAAQCIAAGLQPPYCYDWPGLNAVGTQIWTQIPLNVVAGPNRYETINHKANAFRIKFSRFDLQPGDYISIQNSHQDEVARLQGSYDTNLPVSPWIYDDSFSFHFVSDGENNSSAQGYTISEVEVLRDQTPPSPHKQHHPSIYIVDLLKWNQDKDLSPPYVSTDPGLFAAAPTGAKTNHADGIRVRITSHCTGHIGKNEICIDQTTSSDTKDLKWMSCPISATPTVFSEAGNLRSIYIGDECGQIWTAKVDLTGTWKVRRLLRLNNADGDGQVIAGAKSQDYRKIFSRLDLVISTCPGRRAFGVYFGSGNVQRAAANNALQDPSITNGHEVIGVVWDTASLPDDANLDDLVNVTDAFKVDPRASGNEHGWFIELESGERMLRAPLVFDGLAHFDVFQPVISPTECTSAVGQSRTLIMDNCTAEPLRTPAGSSPSDARTVAVRKDSNIGGGFMLYSRAGKEAIISLGQEGEGKAALPTMKNRPLVRLFLWRPFRATD